MAVSQPTRLCIFCRQIESTSAPCPTLEAIPTPAPGSHPIATLPPAPVTPLPSTDQDLLDNLRQRPSQLCPRCEDYDIVKVFREAQPLDVTQQYLDKGEDGHDNHNQETYDATIKKSEIPLGQLSSLHLAPSCPLCRLIYRILPRTGLEPTDNVLRLIPYRFHLRINGWHTVLPKTKAELAIYLGLYISDLPIPLGLPLNRDGIAYRPANMKGEAIALTPESCFPGRKLHSAKLITPLIEYAMPKKALAYCFTHCGALCSTPQPPELQTALMIDVATRTVAPCPPDCQYFALSYVWGGLIPQPGALESHTLPQTIEDAITVTLNMGYTYLWVDALCIDQTPDPTPAQAAAKRAQLQMMDLIYGCAVLTLVAMAGDNSAAGLPGVSPTSPRVRQAHEMIGGREFVTVPPTLDAEQDASTWDTRAWTLQERVLSTRKLYFTASQMHFTCGRVNIGEATDDDTSSTELDLLDQVKAPQRVAPTGPANTVKAGLGVPDWDRVGYMGILTNYTGRSMTNASDSLNAFLGVISVFSKPLLPQYPFIWGLPLRTDPQFLGWMHDRRQSSPDLPARRRDFPSWSWAGWHGEVLLDSMLPTNIYSNTQMEQHRDLTVRFTGVEGKELEVEGWIARVRVRTEVFSEVVVDGIVDKGEEEEHVIGSIKERNLMHNNSLPTGTYSCLVVERVTHPLFVGGPADRERVFMIVLDWNFMRVGVAKRRVRLV
ncbi:heterokaryon incompatibility protein-domain-containing protein [Bombardia bombarda]|uniref:Heterokaryon incompatibility protein-domain-containing protein n=1 Tax=Bombardia bombarda TaxID=252184 RepID=A0AA39TK32_9PEZI|nr:heterokaryon incompatibility protein-domain-containing protein [Bombardia bombarda]